MPSQIAWLDASSEEQRRMRDIIKLFSEREARDELGIGTIRDAMSDMLFPGTSTLHTRARYLLFVPWSFMEATGQRNPMGAADRSERTLITALKSAVDNGGRFGAQAGTDLKNMPSEIYWAALGRYGIRMDPVATRECVLGDNEAGRGRSADDSAETPAPWHGSIPGAPEGFPGSVPSGFTLTREEAEWLRERMLTAAPGTLLEHYIHHSPTAGSEFAWDDPAVTAISSELETSVGHARAFSAVIHGAQLLYNLMLAEQYRDAGHSGQEGLSEHYRGEMGIWAENLPNEVDLDRWDLHDMIGLAEAQRSRPVPFLTVQFVERWTEQLRQHSPESVGDLDSARSLIVEREQRMKRKNGRLNSDMHLASWGGAAGASRLTFRWRNVQRLLGDLHDGLNSEDVGADA
ncbi:hypothetical protein G6027_17400 [Dietzia sp. SLG310A2-38A2]|uniref:DUF6361 family protein n=1 Tax=Dietzia sp. SLG310A2-38A2 TaxID=1630643 RepID=UPI0015F82792|nr:hypothetical protein [Dietzia sp. SLG310A2-38A2]